MEYLQKLINHLTTTRHQRRIRKSLELMVEETCWPMVRQLQNVYKLRYNEELSEVEAKKVIIRATIGDK